MTSPDFTWLFLKMMAGLVLVLALALILIRFVLPRTRIGRNPRGGWATILDRTPLSREASLLLVKIAEKYLVLGSTGHSVNLITELPKSEGEKIENS